MTGVIRTILPDKKYGFIRAGGKDFFFHRADCLCDWDELVNDAKINSGVVNVQFDVVDSPKGPRAKNVNRE